MNEINIAKVIVSKRKEKGITQDDLANFIGVSKASVSKWETGHCYPDIVLLPQLATYFNISMDELMGYEPQMTKEDIGVLYKELVNEFAEKPFDEAMNRCREIVRKYYSCFPLVFQIGVIYINYGISSKDNDQKIATIAEAKELFIRAKEQSDDIEIKQYSLHLQALCEMLLNNPDEVIDLLKDVKPAPSHKMYLSQAYIMKEQIEEAKTELQESIYNHIVELFDDIPPYLIICADDAERFEEIYKRAMALIEAFNLKKLAPAYIMPFYLAAAQGYLHTNNSEKSLTVLEAYTELVTSDIYPLKVTKGDDFFNLIDDSWKKSSIGVIELPRDEKSIRQSMADEVVENPVFSILFDETRFKRLAEKLKNNIG